MKDLKIRYLVVFVFLCGLMITTQSSAMQPPSYGEEFDPKLPIYPNEETLVGVRKEEISVKINDNDHQTANVVHNFTLENTSTEETVLNFISPKVEYEYRYSDMPPYTNYKIQEDNETLDYKTYHVFNPNYDPENYDQENWRYNYQLVLDLMNYNGVDDLYKDQKVNLYYIPRYGYTVNLEINFQEDSKTIASGIMIITIRN
ncbi:hypothetical protein [Haloplasma contractile]|uniref:Uncharacterized protein n=1 Tax=Haloplasma contractile SSD-17B TaxID=1033810 RepID=U2DY34_9MOLU|nr:hypothetical protein [Haloplasma contractile]ERJ13172.1 hypothetical protein HLPCO_000791 [Haloplasma contractile SSD-17B]